MSNDGWMDKDVAIYTVEYYWAIKKNETMPSAATGMDPEKILLREETRERQISYDITWYYINYFKNYIKLFLKLYKWTYLQNKNRLTGIENTCMGCQRKGKVRNKSEVRD